MMNLSSLVHGARQSAALQQSHPDHGLSLNQTRAHQPYTEMASALSANPYSNKQPVNSTYTRSPQPPPSPPVEEMNRCTLPSISSLIGLANGQSAHQEPREWGPQVRETASTDGRPASEVPTEQERRSRRTGRSQQASPVEYRALPFSQASVSNPRVPLPPTPPPRPDFVFDSAQSPSASSTQSTASASAHSFSGAINNLEPHQQRQPLQPQKRHSLPSDASAGSPYRSSPYASPPAVLSAGPYLSPTEPGAPSTMYFQRPLPSSFPPMSSGSMPPSALGTPAAHSPTDQSNPWQHHHYISPSSSASFPQSQDRYICQTCNKAFSRPSSLRIHSHSHTGEKPFKCPRAGCGKAFSVRSNMKRHERGCHGGGMLGPI